MVRFWKLLLEVQFVGNRLTVMDGLMDTELVRQTNMTKSIGIFTVRSPEPPFISYNFAPKLGFLERKPHDGPRNRTSFSSIERQIYELSIILIWE